METMYFTFGQCHTHSYNGKTLDKDFVVKITALDARTRMFELFDSKWSMQYDELPNMEHFPKGVVEVQ